MHILEICLSESLGGLELYFHRCCLYFLASGHTLLSVVVPSSRLAVLAEKEAIPYVTLNKLHYWTMLAAARRLARFIEFHQINIVHVHHKHDLLLVALAKKISRRKVGLIHTRQMQLPHSKKDFYHRFLYGSLDLLITITDQLKKDVLQKIPVNPEKVVRLYYGVQTPKPAHPEDCASVRHSAAVMHLSDVFHIGIFSRIEFMKGQHLVVEAARILSAKGYCIMFHFYGDTTNLKYTQSLKDKIQAYGLSQWIVFEGFHPHPLSVMCCMDVIILPSLNETFGLTLIEAMRSGVAVIGTKCGGIPEIIDEEETGLLFERANAEQLAGCIERLISCPDLRKKVALAGKKKADAVFDEATHFSKLTTLLEKQVNNLRYSDEY